MSGHVTESWLAVGWARIKLFSVFLVGRSSLVHVRISGAENKVRRLRLQRKRGGCPLSRAFQSALCSLDAEDVCVHFWPWCH